MGRWEAQTCLPAGTYTNALMPTRTVFSACCMALLPFMPSGIPMPAPMPPTTLQGRPSTVACLPAILPTVPAAAVSFWGRGRACAATCLCGTMLPVDMCTPCLPATMGDHACYVLCDCVEWGREDRLEEGDGDCLWFLVCCVCLLGEEGVGCAHRGRRGRSPPLPRHCLVVEWGLEPQEGHSVSVCQADWGRHATHSCSGDIMWTTSTCDECHYRQDRPVGMKLSSGVMTIVCVPPTGRADDEMVTVKCLETLCQEEPNCVKEAGRRGMFNSTCPYSQFHDMRWGDRRF